MLISAPNGCTLVDLVGVLVWGEDREVTKVFVSYRRDDQSRHATERIAYFVREKYGADNVFKDVDNIRPGDNFHETLDEMVSTTDVFLAIIGKNWLEATDDEGERRLFKPDDYVRFEIGLALERGVCVVPVLVDDTAPPSEDDLPHCLRPLTKLQMAKVRPDPDFESDIRRLYNTIENRNQTSCPYRGLKRFDEQHSQYFFGRESIQSRILSKIKHSLASPNQQRFLAIVGASGSGKSSLVRAGIIPALREGRVEGSEHWPIVDMQPERDPIESLAVALAASPGTKHSSGDAAKLIDALRGDERGLHLATRVALKAQEDSHVVFLLVDQFEELFTVCSRVDLRESLIDNLLHASREPGGRTFVVLTMRADFYAKASAYPQLAQALSDHQELVGPMEEADLRRAIEEPVKLTPVTFDPVLVEVLVRDMKAQPGALPFLQHALRELWQNRRGQRLTVAQYNAIGKLEGAIEHKANEVLSSLSDEEKEACRHIFQRLTQPGEGTEDTRRRSTRRELGVSAIVDSTLQKLVENRLITIEKHPNSDSDATIDVSHEALIKGWSRLREWIDSDRQAILAQNRLAEIAKQWKDNGRDESFLYHGTRLAEAVEKLRDRLLAPTEREFLTSSVAQRDRQRSEEEERRRRELRTQQELAETQRQRAEDAERAASQLRRRGWMIRCAAGVAGVLAIVACGLALWSDHLRQVTDETLVSVKDEKKKTDDANQMSRRHLYGAQMLVARHDWEQGRLNRIWDLLDERRFDDEDLRGWEWYYLTSLLHRDEVTCRHIGSVQSVAWSPCGRLIASGGSDCTVRIWAAGTGELVQPLDGHSDTVRAVAWPPKDSTRIASCGDDGTVRVWELSRQIPDVILDVGRHSIRTLAWHPKGRWLASGGEDNTVRIWDVAASREFVALRPVGKTINSIAWSHDGGRIAAAHGDGNDGSADVTIWDTKNWGRVFHKNCSFGASTKSLALTKDGLLILGTELTTVKVYDPQTRRHVSTHKHHLGDVVSIAVDAEGDRFVTAGGSDKTIKVWDMSTKDVVTTLSGHKGSVQSVAWSPDGYKVVSGSSDGTIKIWDVNKIEESSIVRSFSNWVSCVSWHPDGRRLATAYLTPGSGKDEPSALVWDAITGSKIEETYGHTNRVWCVAWSPDGKLLATAGYDNSIRIWSDNTEVLTLDEHRGTIRALAWSPNIKELACVVDNHLTIYDLQSRKIIRSLSGPKHWAVSWSADGRWLAAPGKNGRIIVWDAIEWTKPRILHKHNFQVTSLDWSADSRQIAAGSEDGTVEVWDIDTNMRMFSLRGHTDEVRSISWHPQGKRLATASQDGTVTIRDAITGVAVLILTGHGSQLRTVAWSPDGKRLASGGYDSKVRIWDASTGYDIAPKLNSWRYRAAVVQASNGNASGAGEHAAMLAAAGDEEPLRLLDAARAYGLAAGAEGGPKIYGMQAVKVLTELFDRGFRDLAKIDSSADLSTLSEFPPYMRLLRRLRFRPEGNLIATGSKWKYLDDGSDQGDGWRHASFDDSQWNAGKAELGYGDGDEATRIQRGPNDDPEAEPFPTAYFRHKFQVSDVGKIQSLGLALLRDDGAIVYLNGEEVVRDNMPSTANFRTHALETVGGDDEREFHLFDVKPSSLVEGENVLAVEIHQRSGGSSDVSFDVSLSSNLHTNFTQLLRTGERLAQYEAATKLGELARHIPDQSVPALIEAANSDDPNLRAYATSALGRIGRMPERTIPTLLNALGSDDANVREAAIWALGESASTETELLQRIESVLSDAESVKQLAAACQVLAILGSGATTTLPVLKEYIRHEDHAVRHWAVAALIQIDPKWSLQQRNVTVPLPRGPDEIRHQRYVANWLTEWAWSVAKTGNGERQDYRSSLHAALAARAFASDDFMVLNTIATLFLRLGDYERAARFCNHSDQLSQERFGVSYPLNTIVLAMCYYKLKDEKKLTVLRSRLRLFEPTTGQQIFSGETDRFFRSIDPDISGPRD